MRLVPLLFDHRWITAIAALNLMGALAAIGFLDILMLLAVQVPIGAMIIGLSGRVCVFSVRNQPSKSCFITSLVPTRIRFAIDWSVEQGSLLVRRERLASSPHEEFWRATFDQIRAASRMASSLVNRSSPIPVIVAFLAWPASTNGPLTCLTAAA